MSDELRFLPTVDGSAPYPGKFMWTVENWRERGILFDLVLSEDAHKIMELRNIRRVDGKPLGTDKRLELRPPDMNRVFAAWRAYRKRTANV
jgi:hypothetical protein